MKLLTHVMSIMVPVDTSQGFIGTSVMTKALMTDESPEKLHEIRTRYFLTQCPSRKVSF